MTTNTTYTFSEGMFENVPGTMLGTDKALYIENVRKNGLNYENEKDLDNPSSVVFASYTKRYIWRSANTLTGAYSNKNYVCTNPDYLRVFYEETAGVYKAYGLDYSIANGRDFFYAVSPEQFIFVDGQDGNIAKRIVIDVDGVLSITQIGVTAPISPAVLGGITSDKTAETGQGTGIPAGVNIQYVHTDINEFGEESNPSPILSISTANGLYRGEMNDSVFEFDSVLKGETIKTILTLTCGEYAVKKRLYRRWSGYSASPLSISNFSMVNDYNVLKGQTSITVIDSFVDTPITVSYDKDIASKADDVILFNDTIVLGNTSVTQSLPIEVDSAWEIKITNTNMINYVDPVIRIDLFDDTFKSVLLEGEYLEKIVIGDIVEKIEKHFTFVHGDMITPLNAVFYPFESNQEIPTSPDTNITRRMHARFDVKIPYLVAGADNYIYVAFKDDTFDSTIWEGYTKAVADFKTDDYTAINTVYDFIKPKGEDNYICYNNYAFPLYQNVKVDDNVASKEFVSTVPVTISVNSSNQFAILNSYDLSERFTPRDTPKSMHFSTNVDYRKENNNIIISDKITTSFWFTMDKLNTLSYPAEYNLMFLGSDQRDRYIIVRLYRDDAVTFTLRLYRHEGDETLVLFGTLLLPVLAVSLYNFSFYISVSLNTSLLDLKTPDNSKTDFAMFALTYQQDQTTGAMNDTFYNNISGVIDGFGFYDGTLIYWLTTTMGGNDVYFTQVSVENNKFYDLTDNGDRRFLNNVSHLPDYPIAGIGLDYDHNNDVTLGLQTYEKNKNIFFKPFETEIQKKDGYIRFGKEYIPDVNEINVNEKILRLATIPSYLEDTYQNTIFAFCPSNIYRVVISRDATIAKYEVINELQGVGIYSKSLAVSDRHVYWIANNKSIMRYGKDGLKDVGINKVSPGTNVNLYYCPFNRTLYLSGAICYQVDYDYFYYYKSSYTIIDPNDSYNGISFRSTGKFREFNATNLTGKIVTGMIPALMKIKRFLTNKDLDLTINIYSDRVGTDTQVVKFVIALDGNRRTYFGKGLTGTYLDSNLIHLSPYLKQSIANLKADFINIEITFDNGFEFLNIESGGK